LTLANVLIDPKISAATQGLIDRYYRPLTRLSTNHGLVIADFIIAANTEANISNAYRMNIIEILTKLASFIPCDKRFEDVTRQNVVSFLNSLRKPEESDRLHKWVGAYNHYLTILVKFFK
jgi:hypothetical protein